MTIINTFTKIEYEKKIYIIKKESKRNNKDLRDEIYTQKVK